MSSRKSYRRHKLQATARVLNGLGGCVRERYRPLMAHLVVTRKCNLSCGYCHEYDKASPPVSLELLKSRIDHLATLRTVFVTLTGGETLLHPDIVELVAYIRRQGLTPVMNSNAYLLNERLIHELNEAGLFAMQISIDNLEPNEMSKKSLRPLMPKLRVLAECAQFRVRVNTVLGTGCASDALEVARAATALGFDAKCSFVRDAHGALLPQSDEERETYRKISQLNRHSSNLSESFQEDLLEHGQVNWKCRSGARYFTVCENGLVHLCESSYGTPGKPLLLYGRTDIKQAFHTQKSCAPTCAVAYAHQASRMDSWRSQTEPQEVVKQSWREDNERSLLRVVG